MITEFKFYDLGLVPFDTSCGWVIGLGFEHTAVGVGTDSESALDDLLEGMAARDFDVTDLERRIKSFWNQKDLEGDDKWQYQILLIFNGGRDAQ